MPQTILHIDDDPVLRELMAAIFDADGKIKYQSAENGSKALTMLEKSKPGLILLDLSMPEVDGGQFLQRIRAIDGLKDTPIIIMTQFSNISLQGPYKELGVIGILHKPVDPHTIVNDITSLWSDAA